jgi:TatA/E family protein of Tat protein translocase
MEIVIVLVLALLVFGPKGLPQAGHSLGQAMREFRKATANARSELGLDEVIDGINDVKSSVSLGIKDSGVTEVMADLKSSTTIDLNATGTAAPAVDKPVQVSAPATDAGTIPAEADSSEDAASNAASPDTPTSEETAETPASEETAETPTSEDTAETPAESEVQPTDAVAESDTPAVPVDA